MNELDHEVDEITDVRTCIDLIKLKTYLNKHGNSLEQTTTQVQTMVICPPPGILTPPRQLNQAASESPSSKRSTNNARSHGVRLWKVSLPRFNGDITKFQHIWQSCSAVQLTKVRTYRTCTN